MICSPKIGSRETDVQVVELVTACNPLHVNIQQTRGLKKALEIAGMRKAAGARLVWIESANNTQSALVFNVPREHQWDLPMPRVSA